MEKMACWDGTRRTKSLCSGGHKTTLADESRSSLRLSCISPQIRSAGTSDQWANGHIGQHRQRHTTAHANATHKQHPRPVHRHCHPEDKVHGLVVAGEANRIHAYLGVGGISRSHSGGSCTRHTTLTCHPTDSHFLPQTTAAPTNTIPARSEGKNCAIASRERLVAAPPRQRLRPPRVEKCKLAQSDRLTHDTR